MASRSPASEVRARLAALRNGGPLPPILETDRFDPDLEEPAGRFEPASSDRGPAELDLSPETWFLCDTDEATGRAWPLLYRSMRAIGPRVLARFAPDSNALPVSDLAAFAAIPRCKVAAPADAGTAGEAVSALFEQPSPAYVRISGTSESGLGNGTFRWGTAPVVREGADLTLIGVGGALAEIRALAERLLSIGVSARVLDGASVKPIDGAAILRAARETGAILVAEEHHVLTGYGAMAAALTGLGYPVPVRRVGYADLPLTADPARPGVSAARLDEEAWELLKARGKVQ